jgi:hypothetical protein
MQASFKNFLAIFFFSKRRSSNVTFYVNMGLNDPFPQKKKIFPIKMQSGANFTNIIAHLFIINA